MKLCLSKYSYCNLKYGLPDLYGLKKRTFVTLLGFGLNLVNLFCVILLLWGFRTFVVLIKTKGIVGFGKKEEFSF